VGALRIDLGTLKEGVNRFTFRFGPEEIDLEEEDATYPDPIEADLELVRTGSTLTLRGAIRTRVERTCSRCLAPTDDEIEARLNEAAWIEGDRIRLVDDPFDRGYDYLESRNGAFSLDPLVREAILVCSPIKPLCRPDCRGLCPRCGADLNRGDCDCPKEEPHPAWEALRKLTDHREKRD